MKGFVCLLSALAVCRAYDYAQALRYSLLFYEAQRSGKLPADQKVTWRKDSALNDRGQNGEDLTGGYYDSGDCVKFGFPMAFTTTMLAWGLLDYEGGYIAANALEDGRKAVKWATDYFIKAHVNPNEFYGQIGKVDHSIWCRPEDIPVQGSAYKIDISHPGSDLASETAAALAAASIVFQKSNSSYANILLTHAKQLFDFANKYRGKYTESITDAKGSYETYSYRDELVWGATWLYRATGNETYLKTAEQLYKEFDLIYWNTGFTWDMKISGIELADLGASSDFYRQFFKKQIDYILGDSGRSYVVGFGNNPPTHVRHRSSSCPDAPAVCDWNTYWSAEPNYHTLTGALVGGPDINDTFVDSRTDAVHNTVSCFSNAAFQSALAALVDLKL